ncbi:transmembrane protein 179 [Plakobranchus ocellatus]|uniref:Transmembrane protein 179 n=1 Tax=Plakobranchus ocellatus TaxID=259542 RepID=A0AAV4C3N4_9GAST|nr:transmembrane protein 179 [Plakobranchus ocellatus]
MRRRVMGHLLIVQVGLFVVCVVLSAMVFMPLSLVTQGFRGQCLLFSDISLEWNDNDTVSVDLAVTRYGSQNDCEVPTFIAVSVCVACIIVSWFYLCNIFSASHEDKTASSRVQLPALLVFIALFISTIVAASKITDGFDVWCHNIVDNVPFGSKRDSHVQQVAPGHHPASARKIKADITSKIATWNVRTLHQKGKLENVVQEMERMKLNILGLAEVR